MRLSGVQAVKVLASVLFAAAVTVPARANEKVYAQAVHGTVLILTADGSMGTGVLVDADQRLVVTAAHVPGDNETVTVVFADFDERGRVIAERVHYFPDGRPRGGEAKIIARAAGADLALLQLAELPAGAVAVPLAADSPAPGAAVNVIGNASLLRNALFGTRSGKVDSVYQNEPTTEFPLVAKVVATSIATNKGDSGGPVLNDDGQLVGIVSSGTICWGTAKVAAPAVQEKIAEHPLARQQAVNLSIDVTEVRTLLKQAAADRPVVAPAARPAKAVRSLVGGKWAFTRVADNDILTSEVVFRADGTFRRTVSGMDGVLVHSERGTYGCADGRLTIRPEGEEPVEMHMKWSGDDEVWLGQEHPTLMQRR